MVAHGLPNHSGTHAGCLLFVLMSAYIHMLWHCMRSEHDYSTLLVTLFDFLIHIYVYMYICIYIFKNKKRIVSIQLFAPCQITKKKWKVQAWPTGFLGVPLGKLGHTSAGLPCPF